MCGLVAIRSFEAPVQVRDVDRALEAIAHRGPDGRGSWRSHDGRVVLGHVRLAVRDLAGGAQPIASEDGRVVAVVNGELYGAGLRADLEARGHRLRTHSDSELVVHAWEEWGTGMLPRLRGEFAFALWDDRAQLLVAGRDRFGVKPLAWTRRRDAVYLASRVSALVALGVQPRWNERALWQSASLQYAAPDETLFEDVHQLPAGHVLVVERDRARIERYWDLDYPVRGRPVATNESDAARVLGELFDDAVSERLAADVPVAFQLSGGLDSSAVLASAARVAAAPLHAFTVSFADDDAYDELDAARATARDVGAELSVVRVEDRDVAASFADAVAYAESPCINAHAAAKLALSRAVRDAGFKVVLTGEGADEVLFGYAHLRSDLDETTARVAATNTASAGLMLPSRDGGSISTREIELALGFVPTWILAKAAFGHRVRALVRPGFLARWGHVDAAQALLDRADLAGQLVGRERVEQSAYLWTKLALEGYILRALGDGLEMANGVEGRLPFLDHLLFDHVRALPVSYKIRGGIEKWVFRQAMRGRVPDAVVSREKHPFLAPPMGPATLATLSDAIASKAFEGQPLLDPDAVKKLVVAVPTLSAAERKAVDPALFFALSVAILHDRFRMSS